METNRQDDDFTVDKTFLQSKYASQMRYQIQYKTCPKVWILEHNIDNWATCNGMKELV